MTTNNATTSNTHEQPELTRRMYSVAEAAAILGVGRSTAYELILRDELRATHIGRRRLISPAVLQEFLGTNPPSPVAID